MWPAGRLDSLIGATAAAVLGRNVAVVGDPLESDLPLSWVLDAAEDASPLDAVGAVTDALAQSLATSAAFFLIADTSGRGP